MASGGGQPRLTKEKIIRLKEKHIGSACELFFPQDPLWIVRGKGAHLYDENDQGYLDCINNVCHVGHSNPRVVQAINEQAARLNTNSRYLHENIVLLAERLTATFPEKLTRVYFVNSGSEANDLALRMARAHTGNDDVITLDHAYHGHVTSTIEISPYKSRKLGPASQSSAVHTAHCPDTYSGEYTDMTRPGEDLSQLYAGEVQTIIEKLASEGRRPAAFIAESLQSCGGQVLPPSGYLREVYSRVRAAGGVCIADEVQVGFGRVGSHWWAFQTQGDDIAPDIVTIGKPMGNGHPVAAVVCTDDVDASFASSGVAYFNTYGGNPVSCAAAMAVMDEIEDNNLMAHAITIGSLLKAKFGELKDSHPLIGDVRVMGMFAGLELVQSRETREPASAEAERVKNRMLERHVLLSTDGPNRNVLKFKPPMVFDAVNVEELVTKLDEVLTEVEKERDQ